ncbi:MAG: stage III sporulation protein AB [Clostridia bacterium]|nr:stage III sporulation protein AB [Clostridia bacterium]
MREWIVKGIGALLLLAASVGYGFSMIGEEKRKIRELRALVRLVRHIRESIDGLRRPLPQIFAAFSDPALAENGFLPLLRERGFEAAARETPWRQTEEVKRLLSDFGSSLGRGFADEELALCRYTEAKLSEALAALEKAAPDREKLWRSIPALLALSVILLML